TPCAAPPPPQSRPSRPEPARAVVSPRLSDEARDSQRQVGAARPRAHLQDASRHSRPARGRMDMRICVYSGSNLGFHPRYRAAARRLGRVLADRGMHLVYGGACVGLMGAVADAALEAGGKVTGVIPQALLDEE